MTVWVVPEPLLPEEPEEVDEGGMYMLDGLPYWATHSVITSLINSVKSRHRKELTLDTAVIAAIVPARRARAI
jgi:ribosome biogenesis SPOUT family RNA methylase Rps3